MAAGSTLLGYNKGQPGTNSVLLLDSDPCGADRGVVPLAPMGRTGVWSH